MAEVGDCKRVQQVLCIPDSKLEEIYQLSSSEMEKCLSLVEYWVNTAPDASWEELARMLYQKGEERALGVIKQYVQQGMCSSKLCLNSNVCTLVSLA